MMNLIYFHGGPGLNSNPEKNILKKLYASYGVNLILWNEPSIQRNDNLLDRSSNAFISYLESAEAFFLSKISELNTSVGIIGHSFGSYPLCYLANKYPKLITQLFIISSDLALPFADINMMTISVNDFEKLEDYTKAEELKEVLKYYSGSFDTNTKKGFELLLQNPNLFNNYWNDKNAMQEFLGFYTEPDFAIDINNFFNVRKGLFWGHITLKNNPLPITAFFGKHDKIISENDEIKILTQFFSNLKIVRLDQSAHYSHIEEKEKVLAFMIEALGRQVIKHSAVDFHTTLNL